MLQILIKKHTIVFIIPNTNKYIHDNVRLV